MSPSQSVMILLHAFNQCFPAFDIKSSRKTHIACGSGEIMAIFAGAPDISNWDIQIKGSGKLLHVNFTKRGDE
jgi:hypothetical protein